MGAPSDSLAICNLALDLLSQPAISSISEATVQARRCARWYDATRRELLRMHFWNFAKKQVELSRSSTVTPLEGYTDAYKLPNDYIRLMNIGDTQTSLQQMDFNIVNGYLYLNNSGAAGQIITYIFDEVLVVRYDPLFVRLFAALLAKNMAYSFTQKNTVVQSLAEEVQMLLVQAAGSDGQERPPKKRITSSYLAARRTGSGGRYGLQW